MTKTAYHPDYLTCQHLASYIAQVIRREDQDAFQTYAIAQLYAEPGYWEDKGWRALYDQYLGIR